jgi:hypothetical protein
MANQPIRFKKGDNVLAVDPLWPRYYAARVLREIDLPQKDGGPLYELQFHQDGDMGENASAEMTFFLSGQYIFGGGRLIRHTSDGYAELEDAPHRQEYDVEEVTGHRAHRHGRHPCARSKKTKNCKVTIDYNVVWDGYSYKTWETDEQFGVGSIVQMHSLHRDCSCNTGRGIWRSGRTMKLPRKYWQL